MPSPVEAVPVESVDTPPESPELSLGLPEEELVLPETVGPEFESVELLLATTVPSPVEGEEVLLESLELVVFEVLAVAPDDSDESGRVPLSTVAPEPVAIVPLSLVVDGSLFKEPESVDAVELPTSVPEELPVVSVIPVAED